MNHFITTIALVSLLALGCASTTPNAVPADAATDSSSDAPRTPTCGTGATWCQEDGLCVDTTSDENNCGRCSAMCARGQSCIAGVCRSTERPEPTNPCAAGLELCADGHTCQNLVSDPRNCGRCDNVCGSNQTCVNRACVDISSPTCPAGQARCNSVCIDINSDNANCGTCGNACATGFICRAGNCELPACATGWNRCGGICCDIAADRNNCGGCGIACGVGQVCSAGRCTSTCSAGTITCGASCVNPAADRNNCGACGNACPSGWACFSGACAPTCAAGQTLCGGICRDTNSDNLACGACGRVCGVGTVCRAGNCQADGPSCSSAQTLCGGSCVDTQTNASHCGACGRACGAGQTCSRGACTTTCTAGTTYCSVGGCRDLQRDPENCGSCGRNCGTGSACLAGACTAVMPVGDVTVSAWIANRALFDRMSGNDCYGQSVMVHIYNNTGADPNPQYNSTTVTMGRRGRVRVKFSCGSTWINFTPYIGSSAASVGVGMSLDGGTCTAMVWSNWCAADRGVGTVMAPLQAEVNYPPEPYTCN